MANTAAPRGFFADGNHIRLVNSGPFALFSKNNVTPKR